MIDLPYSKPQTYGAERTVLVGSLDETIMLIWSNLVQITHLSIQLSIYVIKAFPSSYRLYSEPKAYVISFHVNPYRTKASMIAGGMCLQVCENKDTIINILEETYSIGE